MTFLSSVGGFYKVILWFDVSQSQCLWVYISGGFISGCADPNNPNDSGTCYAPPMTPSFSTTDAAKLNASTLTGPLFYKTIKEHTKFLDTIVNDGMYHKRIVDSGYENVKTTKYYRAEKGNPLAATRVETFNMDFNLPAAKLTKVEYIYGYEEGIDTHQARQVFTYDSRPNKPDKLTGYTGPTA